jgi:CAF1 family ribonuclease
MHSVDKFIMPLPESVLDFKDVLGKEIPHLVDTKVFCDHSALKVGFLFSTNIAFL